jgi:hypothetical protein
MKPLRLWRVKAGAEAGAGAKQKRINKWAALGEEGREKGWIVG